MNEKISYGIIGLLVGILLTWLLATTAVNNNNQGMMRMMNMRPMVSNNTLPQPCTAEHGGIGMSGAMNEMMSGLEGKTGDEFDQAFIQEMILHHQGAIDMAETALANAKHQEIKDLAQNIIEAQSEEIDQMNSWKDAWYK